MKKVFAILSSIVIGNYIVASVYAQSLGQLRIEPSLSEYTLEQGGSLDLSLLLLSDETETYEVSYVDYERQEESLEVEIVQYEHESLSDWILSDAEVVIESGQEKKYSAELRVPDNAKTGSYLGGIVFSASDERNETQITSEVSNIIELNVVDASEKTETSERLLNTSYIALFAVLLFGWLFKIMKKRIVK